MSSQDNMKVIEAGLAALNARAIEQLVQLLEPGFKFHAILKPEKLLPRGRISGVEDFANYLKMLYTAFPDLLIEQVTLRTSGKIVYQELLAHGKHAGPVILPNGQHVEPTGLTISIHAEVFYVFNELGGIVACTAYANLLDVRNQFGL